MCSVPVLEKRQSIMNLENYVQQDEHAFAHGTVLHVGCAVTSDEDVVEWKCRRGKWSQKRNVTCPMRGSIFNF